MSDPILEVTFSAGIDESTQEELLDPSMAFTSLANGRYTKKGGYRKRNGYVIYASDGTDATALRRLDSANAASTSLSFTARSAGLRMLNNADQLCVIDGTYLDSTSAAADGWVNRGRVPEATYRHLELPTIGTSDPVEDVVVCNGVIVASYTFTNANGANFDYYGLAVVLDATTHTVIRAPEAIVSSISGLGIETALAAYGTKVVFFSYDFNGHIKAWYLDVSSRTTLAAGWTSIGTIASDVGATRLCVASQSDRVAVVYVNNIGGTSRLTVKTLTSAGVSQTQTVNTSSITPEAWPSLSEGGTTLFVAWAEKSGSPTVTTNFKVIGLDPSNLASTLATTATVIQTVRTNIGGGPTWLVWTGTGTGVLYALNTNVFSSDGVNVRGFNTTAGAVTPLDVTYKFCNSTMLGRPFYRSGRVYAPLGSSITEELVLCDVTPPTTVFTWRPVCVPVQRGLYSPLTSNMRARCAVTSSTTYVHVFNVLRAGSIANGISGAALVEYDFANPYRWKPATLNGSTLLSGGVTCTYDGRRICEAGFLCRPPKATLNTSNAGVLNFTLGGRSYVITYEEVDADGNWHVSGVSNPVSSGNVTNKKVIVTFQPLSITARSEDIIAPTGSAVRISVWVTTDGNAPPYYRLATVANAPMTETISITDENSESQYTSNQLLYTTGNLPGTGEGSSQDHRAPPGLLYHVSYNGFLVGATGNSVYYSSQPIDGQGTWFSPVFVQIIDEDATGLTVQDGSVIVFSARGAWLTSGDAPSDNGLQGGLTTPRRLAIDVGCINANSIVTTDKGTFFQSDRGIELLTRSLSVEHVGFPIQDTLAAYPVITSAVLDTVEGVVIFSLAQGMTAGVATGTGVDVVFDLKLGVWISTDSKHGGSDGQASQDACIAYVSGERRYCWLSTGGIVYMRRSDTDGSRCIDGSSWIPKSGVTPWLKLTGLQGEVYVEKVLLLAKRITGHDLTVSVAFDYEDSFTESRTFSAATIAGELREWFEAGLVRDQMSAIRLRLDDATPSSGTVGTGEGGTWIGLTLAGQPHRGTRRSTATQRAG